MGRKEGICKRCGNTKILQAKSMCNNCYKLVGTPIVKCKKCGKEKPHHAFGFCSNCYLKTFKYDQVKRYSIRKYHNIPLELWKEITKKCLICDFDKIVDLHHLDKNHENTAKENLIGLCPNHHKMLHDERFREEIEKQINEKLSHTN